MPQDVSGSGRVLALDVGERRLGVAVSDPTGILASPLVTVARGTVDEDGATLARIAAEQGARTLVVGLPIALDGRQRLAARKVRAYLDELGLRLPGVAVEFVDERMTTVIAERSLRAQNVRGPARRQVIDQLAASVFLQDWLDRRRSTR